MTTPKHPGTDINCRCYLHYNDPLFIKLIKDYPGDWTPHKKGYRVKWGKVTAYVYRTGSDGEVCVEIVCLKEKYERKANKLWYIDDTLEECVDAIVYDIQTFRGDWLSRLVVFKACPPKIRSFIEPTVLDYIKSSQDTIVDLKNQLKAEQKNLRQLNKLKGVLGL